MGQWLRVCTVCAENVWFLAAIYAAQSQLYLYPQGL